jgi:hypothetical protein
MQIPEHLHQFFWEVDPKKLDDERNWRPVVTRLLEIGDDEAIDWVLKRYGRSGIEQVLRSRYIMELSPNTINFWWKILHLEGEVPCRPSDPRCSPVVSPIPWRPWERESPKAST